MGNPPYRITQATDQILGLFEPMGSEELCLTCQLKHIDADCPSRTNRTECDKYKALSTTLKPRESNGAGSFGKAADTFIGSKLKSKKEKEECKCRTIDGKPNRTYSSDGICLKCQLLIKPQKCQHTYASYPPNTQEFCIYCCQPKPLPEKGKIDYDKLEDWLIEFEDKMCKIIRQYIRQYIINQK